MPAASAAPTIETRYGFGLLVSRQALATATVRCSVANGSFRPYSVCTAGSRLLPLLAVAWNARSRAGKPGPTDAAAVDTSRLTK